MTTDDEKLKARLRHADICAEAQWIRRRAAELRQIAKDLEERADWIEQNL